MVFGNKFFSFKGQKERFANVGNVFKTLIPGNKDRIKANINTRKFGGKTVKKVTETIANHPFISAGAIAGGASVIGRKVVSSIAKKAVSSFSRAKFSTQAKIVGGGLVAVPVLAKSKKAQSLVSEAPKIPGKLVNFGSDLGSFIDNPTKQNAKNLITDNKLVTGALLATGLVASAPLIASSAGAILASKQRKDIAKEVKELGKQSFIPTPLPKSTEKQPIKEVGSPVEPGGLVPVSPSEITGGAKTEPQKKRSKTPKKRRAPTRRQSQSVKIINVNANAS